MRKGNTSSRAERESEWIEANAEYARSLAWTKTVLFRQEDHEHCDICFEPIPASGNPQESTYYVSSDGNAHLCIACYRRHVEPR
jgi:hypothetical protein